MDHIIPTIEELKQKTVRELDAIFRRAAEVAADVTREPAERADAAKTVENIHRVLTRSPEP